jgi:hypothetical protein
MRGKMRTDVIRPDHDCQHAFPKSKVQKTHGEEPRADPHQPDATGMGLTPYLLHLLVHTLLQGRKIRERADMPLRFKSRQKAGLLGRQRQAPASQAFSIQRSFHSEALCIQHFPDP